MCVQWRHGPIHHDGLELSLVLPRPINADRVLQHLKEFATVVLSLERPAWPNRSVPLVAVQFLQVLLQLEPLSAWVGITWPDVPWQPDQITGIVVLRINPGAEAGLGAEDAARAVVIPPC